MSDRNIILIDDCLIIFKKYKFLNLSNFKNINKIIYKNQDGYSIKNHIWVDFAPLSLTT